MTEGAAPARPGFELAWGKLHISFSERATHDVTSMVERNPYGLPLLVLLLAFWIWQARIGKRERERDKLEFAAARKEARRLPKAERKRVK